MYNMHLEFHRWGDNPSASVQLADVLDRSAGQQNSGLFIALMLTRPRLCCLVKFDAVGLLL